MLAVEETETVSNLDMYILDGGVGGVTVCGFYGYIYPHLTPNSDCTPFAYINTQFCEHFP